MRKNNRKKYLIVLIAVILIVVILCIALSGRKAPDEVTSPGAAAEYAAEVMIREDEDGFRAICGAGRDTDEMQFEKTFYQAVKPVSYSFRGTEILWEKDAYSYVGIFMTLDMPDELCLPFYDYFLIKQTSKGAYKLVAPSAAPKKIQEGCGQEQDYGNTDLYQSYLQEVAEAPEETGPIIEAIYDRLTARLEKPDKNTPGDPFYLGVVFAISILELLLLLLWMNFRELFEKKRMWDYYEKLFETAMLPMDAEAEEAIPFADVIVWNEGE